MTIDTTFLRRCIDTLERAMDEIVIHGTTEDFLYDIYCAACVKEFELVLEQSGKLLRKRLANFFARTGRRTVWPSKICSDTPPNTG